MLRKAFTIGAILTAVVIVVILLSGCVEKEKITLPSSESTEPPKPHIYQEEGITVGYNYIGGRPTSASIFVTVDNDGGPGIIKLELYRESKVPARIELIETRYIYLDKGEKIRTSFGVDYPFGGVYTAKAYPAPVVHIRGKPWQDYIPGLSHIDAEVWVREGRGWNLWVINSDGSGKKRLIGDEEKGLEVLFWSKDGKKIFFLQGGDIWVIDSSGKNKKKLTNNMDCREVYLSPKGDKIAFIAKPHGVSWIYTMNSDGTNLKGLVKVSYPHTFSPRLVWSPDGDRIAFTPNAVCSYRIYIINADGSGEKLITSVGGISSVSFNPKGTEIAFFEDNFEDKGIWVVNDDGSNKKFLTAGRKPAWSPDGRKIAFIRGKKHWPGELWTINWDGSEERLLAKDVTVFRWSPDGKRIAFLSSDESLWSLWTINWDGSEERLLAKDVTVFRWSPDGKRIAFISNESLWTINHDGSRKMLISSGDIKSFAWKDDEKIAFVSKVSKSRRVSNQGFKGVEAEIKFFDEKDRLLLFENIPIEVTVNLYTKNKSKLVWSGRSKISSYLETFILRRRPEIGERLKIPIEDIKKLKEARIAEVIVHTGRGDFKDEDKV
ncbi:MAG: hypothetical protein DRN91_03085 [Candidatus Alkanophagales archaeon]|nr:MAG: hypothetical protein DRN91_03085 [Candidatus Alkanophagales archaeon]